MKKLLMGAVILTCFAISLTLVQMSCSKSNAQTARTLAQLNKIAFTRQISTSTSIDIQLWTANYDGTNATQIPVALPSNLTITGDIYTSDVRLSPDGQTVFFSAFDNISTLTSIYSCDISGNNVKLVIPHNGDIVRIGGAY